MRCPNCGRELKGKKKMQEVTINLNEIEAAKKGKQEAEEAFNEVTKDIKEI